MTDWTDSETIKLMLRQMAEEEIKKLARTIPQNIAGNKFKVPPAMAEWMDKNYEQYGGQNDTYYSCAVGYGHGALRVDWVFAKNSVTISFMNPYGERMFILELLKDAL